jgi:glucose-1-phosphate cytidylyltransferase
MKIYSKYGFNITWIYFLHQSDVTIDMQTGKMEVLNNSSEPWKITGLNSMTGGRIKRIYRK